MPITKYLELDSAFRNREIYSNPAQFSVDISQTGMRGQETAFDPVTYAYPQNVFVPFVVVDFLYNPSTTDDVITSTSSNTTFVLYFVGLTQPTTNGYYVGSVLFQTTDVPIGSAKQVRRILEWTFLKDNGTNQYFLVTIESAFDTFNPASALTFNIYNPTDISTPTTPYMFIPSSLGIPNFYNKYLMYNQTRGNYASILSFDKTTHLAKLSDITGLGWATTDAFVIRQTVPRSRGTVATASGNIINLGFVWDQSYMNNFVRIYADIHSVDYTLVKITGFVFTTTVVNGITIYHYTNKAYVTPNITTPLTGLYEILAFDIDNYSPFVFTGTLGAQSQPTSFEITLNSLTLPNTILENGGRIAFYSFVYVILENTSSVAGGTRNLIYSNNPHTYRATFKVPITDMNNQPLLSPFVRLTGNGMKQTMVFKQNSDISFCVVLPNGEIFTTSQVDTSFGNKTNDLLQISALFSLEKI